MKAKLVLLLVMVGVMSVASNALAQGTSKAKTPAKKTPAKAIPDQSRKEPASKAKQPTPVIKTAAKAAVQPEIATEPKPEAKPEAKPILGPTLDTETPIPSLPSDLDVPVKKAGGDPAEPEQSGKYLLRYKAKEMDVLRWEIVHQVEFDTTVAGTTQRAKTYSKSIKAWRFTDVKEDGGLTFHHKVENTSMWQELSGRARVSWDAKDETPPAGFEAVADSLGKTLYVVDIDNQGKILQRLIKHRGPGFDEASDEKQMTIPLPAEEVPVGHTWHLPYDLKLPQEGGAVLKLKARERFDLAKVAGGIATITVETQILTPVSDPAIEAQILQQAGRGEIKFDIEAGRVISQQIDVDKTIVGFRGPASSIHYASRFVERLLPSPLATARQTSGSKAEK